MDELPWLALFLSVGFVCGLIAGDCHGHNTTRQYYRVEAPCKAAHGIVLDGVCVRRDAIIRR